MTTMWIRRTLTLILFTTVPRCRCQDSGAMTTSIQMTSQNGTNSSLETSSPLDSSAPAGVDTIVPTRAPVEARVNNTFILNNGLGLNASEIMDGAQMQAISQGYTDYVIQEIQNFFDLLAAGGWRMRSLSQGGISGSLEYAEGSAVIDQIDDVPCTAATIGMCQEVHSSFAVIVDTAGADRRGYVYVLAQQAADELFKQTQSNIVSSDGGLEKFINASDGGSELHVFAIPDEPTPTSEPTASPTLLDTLSPTTTSVDTFAPSKIPTSSPVAVLTFEGSPVLAPTNEPASVSSGAAAITASVPASKDRNPLVAGMASFLGIALILCGVACVLFLRRRRRHDQAKALAIDHDDNFSVASVSAARKFADSTNIADAYLCDDELQPLGPPKASLRNLAMFEQRPDGDRGYEANSHVQFLAGVLKFDLPRRSSRSLPVVADDDESGRLPPQQSIS